MIAHAYSTGTAISKSADFKVEKRGVPTITYYAGPVGSPPSGYWNYLTGGAWYSGVPNISQVTLNAFSSQVAGTWVADTVTTFYGGWAADAEI